MISNGHPAHTFFAPVHWGAPTGGTARRTVLLGLTIDDATALGAAVGVVGVAGDGYALHIDDMLPNGTVLRCSFDDGDAPGAMAGVAAYVTTIPLLDDTLRDGIGRRTQLVASHDHELAARLGVREVRLENGGIA